MTTTEKSRTLALYDVHSCYAGFKQVLERSSFDNDKDTLIFGGDAVDSFVSNEPHLVIQELMNIKNLIAIWGNHDKWLYEELLCVPPEERVYWKMIDSGWPQNGGDKTVKIYNDNLLEWEIEEQREFMKTWLPYYIDSKNRLFVHGGYHWKFPLLYTVQGHKKALWWDRSLWGEAQARELKWTTMNPELKQEKKKEDFYFDEFNEIFIGHTPLSKHYWMREEMIVPHKAMNVWNLDTGAGGGGKVTLMDVDSKEIWQSDLVKTLY
jgi:serine/threonine protein phosphatase 1